MLHRQTHRAQLTPSVPITRPARFSPAAVAATAMVVAIALLATVLFSAQPRLAPSVAIKLAAQSTTSKETPGERRFGLATAPAKPAGAIRLATYNLENLFDDRDDPALSGEHEDAKVTKPDEDCRMVAQAIKAIDADIIAVQEIESLESLTWFRDKYLAGLGYTHVASIDAGDDRGIEQGVLSRFPIKDVHNWLREPLGGTHPEKFGREQNRYAGQPILFHRSPLRVTIETPVPQSASDGAPAAITAPATTTLTLVIVHYKSGGPGNYWREKEAAKTVELVRQFEQEQPGAPVVVLGDFNAQMTEPPMKILAESGLKDAFEGRSPKDPQNITHASGRVIDHLLLNAPAASRMLPDARFVLGTITRPAGVDFRTTPNPKGWASDHYPVVIDLKFTN